MYKKKILFIGSFKKPNNGYYGGVFFASTTLRDYLVKYDYQIIEMDTTLKDISETRIHKRLPDIIIRQFNFLFTTLSNPKAKHLFVFLSGGGSYVDKYFSILLAKSLGKKIIIFPRSGHLIKNYQNNKFKFFIKSILNLTDKIICQSFFWENYFISLGVMEDKIQVIENWVDNSTTNYSAELSFPKYNPKIELFKMVFLSRIEKDKGIKDLLGLAQRLKGKINFSIDVYGSGSFLEEFRDEIVKLGLSDYIIIKGWLGEDKLNILNQYHLGLFTSRFEGYPNVLLDYILAKIPYLASSLPSITAVGGCDSTYYEAGNVINFGDQVIKISNQYDKTILKSIKLYKQKINHNSVEGAFTKIYKNIV